MIPELSTSLLELLNNEYKKNFLNLDQRFDWLLFLKRLTHLEKPKGIDDNQIGLENCRLNTKVLPPNEMKIESKESTEESAEVDNEKSLINDALNNLKHLGHDLNTKVRFLYGFNQLIS